MTRERIRTDAQRAYWDAIAGEYRRITRISTDDFHYGPQIPGENALRLLPEFRKGATALELGCGEGQNSIVLAKRGLRCTALDVSAKQLAVARRLAEREGVNIAFSRGSLEDFGAAVGRRKFDFVHSSHAMEFVEDPAAVVRAMARALKPGGTLMVSTVHPLYNGEWLEGEFEDENGADAGPAGSGLFLTDYFSPPDDVRDDASGHAVSRAWPVSAWFDFFRTAGLTVARMAEPAAVADSPYTSDDWADHGGQLDRIPSTIILVGMKV